MLGRRSPVVILSLAVFAISCGYHKPEAPPPPPPPAAARVVRFTVEPASIQGGQGVTLRWEVTGAASVSIDNGIGMVAATGSRLVFPSGYTVDGCAGGGNAAALRLV